MDIFAYFIYLIVGVCAGAITGLAGASAVVITAPLLIIFLDMDAYLAIGLSLATDVVAALVAARIYHKHKNVSLMPAIPLILFSFIGITIGSYLSKFMASVHLSFLNGLSTLILGILVLSKKGNLKEFNINFFENLGKTAKKKFIILAVAGFIIGMVSGMFGSGGGIMLLIVLIFVLGYSVHLAVGTSVLIMIFLAFFGAVSHFYYKPFSIIVLVISCAGAFFGAIYSSKIANMLSEKKLKITVGIIFVVLGLGLALKAVLNYFL
jgi:uncharacterized membrane protein YfcA